MPGVYRRRPPTRPRRRWVPTAGASQIAVPISDILQGSWTNEIGGSSLWPSIDETSPNDGDYIQSSGTPVNDACEVKLTSLGDPLSSNNHIISYRFEKDVASNVIDLTIELRQGTTVIASWVHSNVAAAWLTSSQVLTTAQADSITDYSDLRLRFSANQSA